MRGGNNICFETLTSPFDVVSISFNFCSLEAFNQARNAKDGKGAPEWMSEWTIFYWGWWIAWSPFVGMFIGKISKGWLI